MVSNLVGDAVVVILSLALSGAAWMTMAIGTKRVYGNLKTRGRSDFESTVAAVGCAIVLFLGGWMPLSLYWSVKWIQKVSHHNCANQLQGGG